MEGKVKVFLYGKERIYENGTALYKIAEEFSEKEEHEIVLAKINNKLMELSNSVEKDCEIKFVTVGEKIGIDTYRRSMPLLMLKAFDDVYGKKNKKKIEICYSLSKGLFCKISDGEKFTQELLEKTKKRMFELVEKNIKLNKKSVKTSEAVDFFASCKMYDKEKLLKYRRVSRSNIYELEGFKGYYFGYMVPTTGYLKYFDLFLYDIGFVLQMPVINAPEVVPEFCPQNKVYNVLKESEKWAKMLGVNSVGALNEQIVEGNVVDLIQVQEALFEKKIIDITNKISESKDKKIILIAGPSSSGKTTFSHRLAIQLKAVGFKPHLIGVDDYFHGRDKTPRDEKGDYDFECLEAIDIKQLNEDMTDLLDGKMVEIPKYNFILGKREYNGKFLQMKESDILILEGIHCLNDKLSESLPKESKFKIYISALAQLNLDEHNRMSSTDGRLIRRITRDSRSRGVDARGTIARWSSVRNGEERHIFPYQESADIMINSSMIYELSILKQYAEPLLFKVPKECPEFDEAKRLLKFLDYFLSVDSEKIPSNSIIREFIGGSCF